MLTFLKKHTITKTVKQITGAKVKIIGHKRRAESKKNININTYILNLLIYNIL